MTSGLVLAAGSAAAVESSLDMQPQLQGGVSGDTVFTSAAAGQGVSLPSLDGGASASAGATGGVQTAQADGSAAAGGANTGSATVPGMLNSVPTSVISGDASSMARDVADRLALSNGGNGGSFDGGVGGDGSLDVPAVPVPASGLLLVAGLGALAYRRKR